MRPPCPSTISDDLVTLTCELTARHHEDHLRGWLTWDDDGAWGARRHWPHGKPGSLPSGGPSHSAGDSGAGRYGVGGDAR